MSTEVKKPPLLMSEEDRDDVFAMFSAKPSYSSTYDTVFLSLLPLFPNPEVVQVRYARYQNELVAYMWHCAWHGYHREDVVPLCSAMDAKRIAAQFDGVPEIRLIVTPEPHGYKPKLLLHMFGTCSGIAHVSVLLQVDDYFIVGKALCISEAFEYHPVRQKHSFGSVVDGMYTPRHILLDKDGGYSVTLQTELNATVYRRIAHHMNVNVFGSGGLCREVLETFGYHDTAYEELRRLGYYLSVTCYNVHDYCSNDSTYKRERGLGARTECRQCYSPRSLNDLAVEQSTPIPAIQRTPACQFYIDTAIPRNRNQMIDAVYAMINDTPTKKSSKLC